MVYEVRYYPRFSASTPRGGGWWLLIYSTVDGGRWPRNLFLRGQRGGGLGIYVRRKRALESISPWTGAGGLGIYSLMNEGGVLGIYFPMNWKVWNLFPRGLGERTLDSIPPWTRDHGIYSPLWGGMGPWKRIPHRRETF